MIRRTVFSIALTLLLAGAATASTVRGKVLRTDGNAYTGAQVTLENAAIGKTATAYTAEDGVFFLRNVPPGAYTMHVKTPKSMNKYAVTVTQDATSEVADVRVP